jgi:hypothetical protein
MNQDQQPRPWWKDNWPVLALLAAVIVIAAAGILGYWQSWQRPFWDWLELLIIPIVLGAGALWFNTQQTRKAEQERELRELVRDRELAQEQVRGEALQQYLDRMQELILDKGLRRSEKDAEIRSVSRARTLAVLRSLDGARKGLVLRFLHEADLIGKAVGERRVIEAIIDLLTADLSGADLSGADLSGAVLSYANLSDANLRDANLRDANLSNANLSNANLSGARNWTNQQLAQAGSLVGATLPDRTVTKGGEDWEKFKKG